MGMDDNVIDRLFGVHAQARAVMEYLDRSPDFAEYIDHYYRVALTTRPWYNGRENGIVVSMRPDWIGGSGPVLHIAFFEHRNSDSICALRWETDRPYWNGVDDPNKAIDDAYKGGTKFDLDHTVAVGEAEKMAEWVYEQLAAFYRLHHVFTDAKQAAERA